MLVAVAQSPAVVVALSEQTGATGVTEPGASSSDALQSAQSQQRILQWVAPALTAVLIVLAAQQGEQQRPLAGLKHR